MDRAELATYVKARAEDVDVQSALHKLETTIGDTGARPMVLIQPGVESDDPAVRRPTVWLLGWRREDATPIHDHGMSQAAIMILDGIVTEDVYHVPREYDPRAGCEQEHPPAQRDLHAGSLLTVKAPYVHTFRNDSGEVAVSLHAYYPPLNDMNYFKHQEGRLSWIGEWKEGENP